MFLGCDGWVWKADEETRFERRRPEFSEGAFRFKVIFNLGVPFIPSGLLAGNLVCVKVNLERATGEGLAVLAIDKFFSFLAGPDPAWA